MCLRPKLYERFFRYDEVSIKRTSKTINHLELSSFKLSQATTPTKYTKRIFVFPGPATQTTPTENYLLFTLCTSFNLDLPPSFQHHDQQTKAKPTSTSQPRPHLRIPRLASPPNLLHHPPKPPTPPALPPRTKSHARAPRLPTLPPSNPPRTSPNPTPTTSLPHERLQVPQYFKRESPPPPRPRRKRQRTRLRDRAPHGKPPHHLPNTLLPHVRCGRGIRGRR